MRGTGDMTSLWASLGPSLKVFGLCAVMVSAAPIALAQQMTRQATAIGEAEQPQPAARDDDGSWKSVVATPDAPDALGPYSQAIRVDDLVFLGGQLAIDPITNELNPSAPIEEQTALVLNHLRTVLEADGLTLNHVVSTTIYMTDLEEFDRMDTVYATYFMDKPPARTTVGVSRLPNDAAIEISAIAIRR